MSYGFYLCKAVSANNYSSLTMEQQLDGYEANYTSNAAPMFQEAFCCPDGIKRLNMVGCELAVLWIEEAITCMTELPEVYEAMNPKNGWGDSAGALLLLIKLRSWCLERPDCYIRVVN